MEILVKPDSLKPPKEMEVNYSPLRLSVLTYIRLVSYLFTVCIKTHLNLNMSSLNETLHKCLISNFKVCFNVQIVNSLK